MLGTSWNRRHNAALGQQRLFPLGWTTQCQMDVCSVANLSLGMSVWQCERHGIWAVLGFCPPFSEKQRKSFRPLVKQASHTPALLICPLKAPFHISWGRHARHAKSFHSPINPFPLMLIKKTSFIFSLPTSNLRVKACLYANDLLAPDAALLETCWLSYMDKKNQSAKFGLILI